MTTTVMTYGKWQSYFAMIAFTFFELLIRLYMPTDRTKPENKFIYTVITIICLTGQIISDYLVCAPPIKSGVIDLRSIVVSHLAALALFGDIYLYHSEGDMGLLFACWRIGSMAMSTIIIPVSVRMVTHESIVRMATDNEENMEEDGYA